MFSRKLLSSSRSIIGANVLGFKNTGGAVRKLHVAYAPPLVKVSNAEKLFYGVFLALAMGGYPTWVLYHIPDYQNEDRNTYTGK